MPSSSHRFFFFLSTYIIHLHLVSLFCSRPLTLLPIQRCQNDIIALKEQLSSYALQVCSTCILEDEENHSWADPRPFFEVKSCLPAPHFKNNLLVQ